MVWRLAQWRISEHFLVGLQQTYLKEQTLNLPLYQIFIQFSMSVRSFLPCGWTAILFGKFWLVRLL